MFARVSVTFLFIVLCLTAIGQIQNVDTRTRLENQRKEILKAIKSTENELANLKKTEKISLEQLNVLQVKEAKRQELIDNIRGELNEIDNSIAKFTAEIDKLKKKLEKYKIRYAQSIRYTYSSRNTYSMLAFLFSSKGFNDAFRRMQVLQTIRAVRRQQADEIRSTHADIYNKLALLQADKASKSGLLVQQMQQQKVLDSEKVAVNKMVQSFEARAGELNVALEKKRKMEERINDAIKAIIGAEMKTTEMRAREATSESGTTSKPKTPNMPALTPVEADLAARFQKQKGGLSWPIENGNISCRFGKYCIKKIDYYNNGIDIQPVGFSPVRSVFDGIVTRVVDLDGKTIIVIQHGNYFSVYCNMLKSNVAKGQEVKAAQELGPVANNEDGLPTLNFQIWKADGAKAETTMLNPEDWLKKRD
jgi:murein hydrolase activator